MSQSQCSQPLANGQRPLTRKPPSSGTARPLGANTPRDHGRSLAVHLARARSSGR